MVPEISNDSKREVRDMSKTLQRANKRSSWKIAKDLPTSFLYAAKGLKYAFSTQRNFRIHVGFALGAFGLSFFLGLNKSDLAIMVVPDDSQPTTSRLGDLQGQRWYRLANQCRRARSVKCHALRLARA